MAKDALAKVSADDREDMYTAERASAKRSKRIFSFKRKMEAIKHFFVAANFRT